MKNKVKLQFLLFKSLMKTKNLNSIFTSSFLCVSLILTVFVFFFTNQQIKKVQALKLYGTYQFGFEDVEEEKINQILLEPNISAGTKYISDTSQTENGFEQHIRCSEDFLNLSNYKLLYGRFPETDAEVLCEGWMLFQEGYTQDEHIGSIVFLNDKPYVVSGVIALNQTSTIEGFVCKTFVTNISFSDPEEKYGVLLRTNNQKYYNSLENIQKKYSINSKYVHLNQDFLTFVGIDARGMPEGIEADAYMLIILLLFVLTLLLSGAFSNLFAHGTIKTVSIFREFGINKSKIVFSFSLLLFCIFLFSSFMAVLFIWCGFSSIKLLGAITEEFTFPVLYASLGAMVFISISTLICALVIVSVTLGKLHKGLFNSALVRNRMRENQLTEKRLFWKLAQLNRKSTPIRSSLLCVLLTFCIILFSTVTYTVFCIYKLNLEETNFDFKVDFVYKSYAEQYAGTSAHQETYDNLMKQNELFTSYPIFTDETHVKIPKRKITKGHQKYLSNSSPEYVIRFENQTTQIIEIPITIVGLTRNQLELLADENLNIQNVLSKNRVIAVNRVQPLSGRGYEVGFEIGDKLSFETLTSSKIELEIFALIESLDLPNFIDYDTPVLLVDLDTFYQFNSLHYAPIVYLDAQNSTSNEIQKYFLGNSTVSLTDLKELNEYLSEQLFFFLFSLLSLIALLCIFTSVNIATLIRMKYSLNVKQYDALYAIGISRRNISKIFLFESCQLTIIAIFIGTVCSSFLTYFLYKYIISMFGYYAYSLPVVIQFSTAALVCAMIALSLISLNRGGFLNFKRKQ